MRLIPSKSEFGALVAIAEDERSMARRQLCADPAPAALRDGGQHRSAAVDDHHDRSFRHVAALQIRLEPVQVQSGEQHAGGLVSEMNWQGYRQQADSGGAADREFADDKPVGEKRIAKVRPVAHRIGRRAFGIAHHPALPIDRTHGRIRRKIGQHGSKAIAARLRAERLDRRQARQRDHELPAALEDIKQAGGDGAGLAQRLIVQLGHARAPQIDLGGDLDYQSGQNRDHHQQKEPDTETHGTPARSWLSSRRAERSVRQLRSERSRSLDVPSP
jgi:hypothetical protein